MSGPDISVVVDERLGNSSYVVDLGDGRALVVDPERDPRPYLADAERRGLRIGLTAETHLHADFVSGSRELAARGATVVATRAGELEHPHHSLAGGETLDLGGLTLEAIRSRCSTGPTGGVRRQPLRSKAEPRSDSSQI